MSVLVQDRWWVPKWALLLVWHCIVFAHNSPYDVSYPNIMIEANAPHNSAAGVFNEFMVDNDIANDNCNHGPLGQHGNPDAIGPIQAI